MADNLTVHERLASLRKILADHGDTEGVKTIDATVNFLDRAISVSVELVEAINDTGGAVMDGNGNIVPIVDEDWVDLGSIYETACAVMGVEPRMVDKDDDE